MKFDISGMSCAACSARVERAVRAVSGVAECSVNLLTNSMNTTGGDANEIIAAVRAAGYGAKVSGERKISGEAVQKPGGEMRLIAIRLIISAGLLLPLMYFSMGHMIGLPYGIFEGNYIAIALIQLLLSAACMIINGKFFVSGVKGALHGAPNMDTLVALGSGASFIYSTALLFVMSFSVSSGGMGAGAVYAHGFYFESAAMILVLITVGKLLEARAKGKTTGAIEALMELAPKEARIMRDGEEVVIDTSELRVGDIFVVRPGESFAADGEIVLGECAVDESALSGESIPIDKAIGDKVYAATINKSGYVNCRATSVAEDTALSGIIKMVSDASATKAPIAKIADRVSAVFVPVVMLISLVTLAVWLILDYGIGFALGRAVSVLVISCPCALGLATPVAIMVGNGLGASRGILFKNAEALERLGGVRTVLLDKTGTITEGLPEVVDVIPIGISSNELLTYALGAEIGSEHPLALAIVNHCSQNNINKPTFSSFENLPGSGVRAVVMGELIEGGSYKFYKSTHKESSFADEKYSELSSVGKTPLYFTKNGTLIGIIAVSDKVRADSADAVGEFGTLGVKSVMLTGDNLQTANAIAASVGIDEVIAEVMPSGKEAAVRKYSETGSVLMVGDGINDAVALVSAEVGMAIGRGVDIAIESADVILMKDSLMDAALAIRISRKTVRNIKQNLFWAFFYNVISIPLAAGAFVPLGITLNPMFGALAMSMSSLFVVGNALRLNFFGMSDKKREPSAADGYLTLIVSGMMCSHCQSRVEAALNEIPEIISASADAKTGKVRLELSGPVSTDAIKSAIEADGYKLKAIKKAKK